LPLEFSPGEAWNYSMAFDVLGAVIEAASGQTLDAYLNEAIFTPLGMRETGFHAIRVDGRSNSGGIHARAERSSSRSGAVARSRLLPSGRLLSGGGGLLSTRAITCGSPRCF
jgi:CubicO group peptidase (beta-lactamase class C family)